MVIRLAKLATEADLMDQQMRALQTKNRTLWTEQEIRDYEARKERIAQLRTKLNAIERRN